MATSKDSEPAAGVQTPEKPACPGRGREAYDARVRGHSLAQDATTGSRVHKASRATFVEKPLISLGNKFTKAVGFFGVGLLFTEGRTTKHTVSLQDLKS